MNVIAMLERCARGQSKQDYDPTLPATYLAPERMWREQEIISDWDNHPMSCEDV